MAIKAVANEATEFLDAMDAFYYALPVQFRPGYYRLHSRTGAVYYKKRWNASPVQRAQAIYRNLDKLDLTKLFQNVLRNEVTDRVVGKIGQRMSKSARDNNLPHGLMLGPWDTFNPLA